MGIAAIIIGDEILSGRRRDQHFDKLRALLSERGLKLDWVRYEGDEPRRLQQALRESFATGDTVFCFGGIGATPDDRTRQCASAALGLELVLHPEAERAIRDRFGDEITPHRLQMGVFPVGSEIVPNPYNQIPGFSIQQHFFVPGFPVMAWPMVEWALDQRLAHLHHAADYTEQSIVIWEAYEGRLIGLMERMIQDFPQATLFSLPSLSADGARRSVELGMKGPVACVDAAMAEIRLAVAELGYDFEEKA